MTTSAAAAAPSARGPWPPGVSTTTWQSHAAAHCRRPSRIASERRRGPAGVGTIRAGCPSGVHAHAAASVGAPSKMVRSCSWDGTRGGRPAPPLRGRGVRPVRRAWRTGAGPGACHTEAAWGPAHQVVAPPQGSKSTRTASSAAARWTARVDLPTPPFHWTIVKTATVRTVPHVDPVRHALGVPPAQTPPYVQAVHPVPRVPEVRGIP